MVAETRPLANSLPAAVLHWASERPNDVALREKRLGVWAETSWRGYADGIAATGRMLWQLGVRPGDAIAILSDNRSEWLYADLGAEGIGARSVGIYQTNPPADVAYVVAHSGAKVLFCEDQEQVDKALAIRDETPALEKIVVFDPRGTRHYDDPRLTRWHAFRQQGDDLLAEQPGWFAERVAELDPDAAAMVVYTSGTTGQPKGALLTHANVMALGQRMAPLVDATADDTLLSYLPLCHVAEKIFTLFVPLHVGAIVHFGESIATVREDLAEVSPTVFLGVPRIWEKVHASVTLKMKDSSWLKRTLFQRCVDAGSAIAARRTQGNDSLRDRLVWRIADLLIFRPLQERLGLRNCRLPASGAAPISTELLGWYHGIGVPIIEGYGQTECGGVSHMNRLSDIRLGTVGAPLPGVDCRIAEDGEILVRGPNVFPGYLHNEAATAETVDADGWLHTGDVGRADEAGYLTITGRKKEIIVTSGGKNLSPEKIENVLKLSPYIKEAVAIGDGRKFVAALVQIDVDAVGDWASRRRLTFTSFEDLSGKEEVGKLVGDEIDRLNAELAQVEQVRQFRLFRKELHQDDGELTATQKVRRRAIHDIHAELIESLYAGGGR